MDIPDSEEVPFHFWLTDFGKEMDILYDRMGKYVRSCHIDGLYTKLYLKPNKTTRLEVIGKKVTETNPFDVIQKLVYGKSHLLEAEYRNELSFQQLDQSVESLNDTVRNNTVSELQIKKLEDKQSEIQEDQITQLYQLDKIQTQQETQHTELSTHLQNQMEVLGRLAMVQENSNNNTTELLSQLVKNETMQIQILNEKFESLFHQNREIMDNQDRILTENKLINYKLNRIESKGIFKKLKRFFKKIFKRKKQSRR